MQKTYVLDTNVLLQAPHALESFEDNNIVLPIVVLEELDGLKNSEGDLGANARAVIRRMEALRQQGDLVKGAALPNGGMLRLELNHTAIELPPGFANGKPDNRLLQVCRALLQDGNPAILVTQDITLRIKADMMGIPAEDFTTDQAPEVKRQYTGRSSAYIPAKKIPDFKKEGIKARHIYGVGKGDKCKKLDLCENQFFLLQPDNSSKKIYWQDMRTDGYCLCNTVA